MRQPFDFSHLDHLIEIGRGGGVIIWPETIIITTAYDKRLGEKNAFFSIKCVQRKELDSVFHNVEGKSSILFAMSCVYAIARFQYIF